MDGMQLKKNKKEEIEKVELTHRQREEIAWDTLRNFDRTSQIDGVVSGKDYTYLNKDTLADLENDLLNEKGSKSDSFMLMYTAVKELNELALSDGQKTLQNGQLESVDFYEALYSAKRHVSNYLFNHSGYHFTDKGDRRVQIAQRIQNLLMDLEKTVDTAQKDMPEESLRKLQYRRAGLNDEQIREEEEKLKNQKQLNDLMRISRTGNYGPDMNGEGAEQARRDWVINGYTEELTEALVGANKFDKEKIDRFIAKLEDDNNKAIANRLSVSIIVDNAVNVTQNLPWLKEDLKDFICGKLEEKDWVKKTTDLATIIFGLVEDYKRENKVNLDRCSVRKQDICKKLGVDLENTNFFEYSDVKTLMTVESDEMFNRLLENHVTAVRNNDELIKKLLDTEYSIASRASIEEKLKANLGSLRVFGTIDQIFEQVNFFIETLKYTAPVEYMRERSLKNMLNDMGIDWVHRDSFVLAVTGNNPESFDVYNEDFLKEKAESYVNQYKSNTKLLNEFRNKKGIMLLESDWDVVEKLAESAGTTSTKSFKDALALFGHSNYAMHKGTISRREYMSKRNFRDAQREPARIKRAREEKARIDELKELMKDHFAVSFYIDESQQKEDYTKEDPYLVARRLDASYRGGTQREAQKAAEAEAKRRYKTRYLKVKNTLVDAGVPYLEADKYIQNCKWLISGIEDTGNDMTDDVRLGIERKNMERFGVRDFQDALWRFRDMARSRKNPESKERIRKANERYKAGYDRLKDYGDGKYKEYIDVLVSIPEVFAAMTDPDPDKLEQFCSETLDEKLEAFIEGTRRSVLGYKPENDEPKSQGWVSAAIRKQYATIYLKQIYDGDMEGDADFFERDLLAYQEGFNEAKVDGRHSINSNFKAINKEIQKLVKNSDIEKANVNIIQLRAGYRVYELMEDTEEFRKILDYKQVKSIAETCVEFARTQVDKTEDQTVRDNITKIYDENDISEEEKKAEAAYQKAIKEREKGLAERKKFLQTDVSTLQNVRQGKSLVRVAEKGARRVDLNTKKAETMRGRIQKYVGNYNLPPVLRDAIIERGASEAFASRFNDIMWYNSKLVKHATAMEKLYLFLRPNKDYPDGMSDEEAQMYIVKCYNTASVRKSLFEDPSGPNVKNIRESADYRRFREDYAKLMKLEEGQIEDPALEDERVEMSRNLRAMLITGVGAMDENGKKVGYDHPEVHKIIGEAIDKSDRYVRYSARLSKLIRARVEEDNNTNNLRMDEYSINRKVYAARAYFMNTMLEELKAGREFNEEAWKTRIGEVHDDKHLWQNLISRQRQTDAKSLKKTQSFRVDSEFGEGSIANAIKRHTYLFKGNVNKYEALDEDQKKFFAVALMLMDKGSIGMGTEGTAALLTPRQVKSAISTEIEAQLQKYIAGQPYHIDVDYKQAYNKLINYGETKLLYMEGEALSKSAFDKALHFAQTVYAKRAAFGERDDERLNNGEQSLSMAVNFGRVDQRNAVDELRDKYLTTNDIRELLMNYATQDTSERTSDLVTNTASMAFSMGRNLSAGTKAYQDAVFMKKVTEFKRRFSRMSDADMKLFVRVMQQRSVLDKTTIPKDPDDPNDEIPDYADQERRNTLLEALCGDAQTRTDVMAGFDSYDSCYQAMVNALSFQLRDDLNFKGRPLTEDIYAKGALKRQSLVDWNLIENAFKFMDEVKERRAYITAMRHASDYIEVSGNQEAKKEYDILKEQYKDKKDFTQNKFEDYIKRQADKDKTEERDRIIAGYFSLTDKEKNLFFKVVAQRDLLDISKKDYKKNFFGLADRNYVNQAGRDKLLDEYIESSLENNMGIQLKPGDHYDAMKSLFSTQLDDTQKFSSDKSIAKMEATERNLFMLRSTAIDWKLFRRALNFVNRAREELEYREGNAQLYRGAGSLSQNGKFTMNYSFLRKNFHKTGNQWFRFVGRLAVRTVRDELEADDKLKLLLNGLNAVNVATRVLGAGENNPVSGGIDWLTAKTKEFQNNIDRIDTKELTKEQKKANDKARKSRSKELAKARKKAAKTESEKQKEKQEEAERRANLGYFEAFYESADDIIENASSVNDAVQSVAKYMRTTYLTRFRQFKQFTETKDVKQKEDKKNLVNRMTADSHQDTSYGDFRDAILKTAKKYGELKDFVDDTSDVLDAIGLEDFRKMVGYATEKAVYKFVNVNILNNQVNLSGNEKLKDEATAYRQSAKKVADEFMQGVFKDVVGEDFANSLKELENNYYDVSDIVQKQVKSTVKYIKYAQRCAQHVTNVAQSFAGIKELSNASKSAEKHKDEDDAKLQKANDERLSPEQAEMVDRIAKKHKAMAGLGKEVGMVVKSFNIAENAIDMAFDTAETFSNDISITAEVVTKSVKAALDFIMFAARIATDRVSLNRYFIDTDAGNEVVNKIKEGYIKAGNVEGAKYIENRMKAHQDSSADGNTTLVDLISDARGYEHTSELVENTGMSLAQSLVFSASKYNPIMETRIMAVTVMNVMGLGNLVGDISPKTAEKLFNSFNMKR